MSVVDASAPEASVAAVATRMVSRTQEERTAHTKEALLNATIDCLVDLGYSGTTTREVAARAGVSRGAQTHHYPAKDDLVVAAVRHLFDVQAGRAIEDFEALPESDRTLEQGVAILWKIVQGPSYPAVLEVIVAGRTDPELRKVVNQVAAELQEMATGLLRFLFPAIEDDSVARTIIDVAFAVTQGSALSQYAGYGDPDHAIALIRSLARLVNTDNADVLKGLVNALDR